MSDYLSDDDLDRLKAENPEVATQDCPTCHGAKKYTLGGEVHNCDCTEQRRLFLRYLQAGIGLTYQRLGWTDFGAEVPERVVSYITKAPFYLDQGLGLLFTGVQKGTGKTLLANLVLKELVNRGYSCYSTTFPQVIEEFTAGWSDASAKVRFAERFMKTRVLLLDDLGKEFVRANRLQQSTFDYILRTRVQQSRPTIMTTNMTSDELCRGYGSAVLSLLVEKSVEIPLDGLDFRPVAYDRSLGIAESEESRPIT